LVIPIERTIDISEETAADPAENPWCDQFSITQFLEPLPPGRQKFNFAALKAAQSRQ